MVGTASRSAQSTRQVLRVVLWALIIVAAFVILRSLPISAGLDLLQRKVTAFGPWGPIIFGVAYFLAAVLFVPGSALTLAAGAIFGIPGGFATVSIASTAAAGTSFLIARYLARDKVRALADSNRTFGAIDRAIAQGGWRIIALLRLSPAVPFSLGNYLYGLTPVEFWPYVIASWIAMMPGSFLYVYLGFVGRTAAGAASSAAPAGRNVWQYVLLAAGLLATVAVSVYVTRLARKALKETALTKPAASNEETQAPAASPAARARSLVGLGAVAALAVGLVACAHIAKPRLAGLFGPPKATLTEAYADTTATGTFDHSALDRVLKTHVRDGGFVDYAALAGDSAQLDAYIASLANATPDGLSRDERLALLINAYNAFTLRLILDHAPVASIRDIPAEKRWKAVRWNLAGTLYSLDQIEHEQIRPRFAEPRVHFALVCAAVGCPPLRQGAYVGSRIQEQLTDQAAYVHASPRWLRLDTKAGELRLTALYDWFAGDFLQQAPTVAAFAARSSPELMTLIKSGREPRVTFLDYDWTLNSIENAARATAP